MRKGGIRRFCDDNVKMEMLGLRMRGYSLLEIAHKYKVDHTTIVYHCKAAGIVLNKKNQELARQLESEGVSIEEIAQKLNSFPEVIKYYSSREDMRSRFRPNRQEKLVPIFKDHNPELLKKINSNYVANIDSTPIHRVDENGVEWRKEGEEWVCLGKSISSSKNRVYIANAKKRVLEKKRLEMLTY